jgi:hypothetical protein
MHPDEHPYANHQSMSALKQLTRAEKQAATRAGLLESAANVFALSGFQAASVEEITEGRLFRLGGPVC